MADGIPSQLKLLNERVDQVEQSQSDLQRVIDTEILPSVRRAVQIALRSLKAVRASKKTEKRHAKK